MECRILLTFTGHGSRGFLELSMSEVPLGGAEVKYPKTLAPPSTFKKAPAKKKAPRSSDKSHPEAMFDEGLSEE